MTTTLLHGDCRDVLRTLADASVQCVVTSPPYWGLRSYLPVDHPDKHREIGSEPMPEAYVANLVDVFREVWRVLRPDGTVWLNIGDGFARDIAKGQHKPGDSGKQNYIVEDGGGRAAGGVSFARNATLGSSDGFVATADRPGSRSGAIGLKPKDLLMMPARVALALQADGWWLRSDNVWGKPNGLPESVEDRPTRSHEYVFLLTKSGSPLFWTHEDGRCVEERPTPEYRWRHRQTNEELLTAPRGWPESGKETWRRVNLWSAHDYYYDHEAVRTAPKASTQTQLAKPYLGESTKAHDISGVQNASDIKRRITDKQRGHSRRHDGSNDRWDAMSKAEQIAEGGNLRSVWWISPAQYRDAHFAVMPDALVEICIRAGTKEGDTVLDPFAGASTTLLVADRMRRHGIGIELNPEYVAMGERRVEKDAGLFAEIATRHPT